MNMKKIICTLLVTILTLGLCFSFTACGKNDEKTIIVGASSTPHAEILNFIKDDIKEKGYTLEVEVFNDYVTPNQALNYGDIDANYFQHLPYLNNYNKQNGTSLVSAGVIHYEPLAIFGNGVTLDNIPAGTPIFIPSDASNCTRALILLAENNVITLPDDASVEKGVTVLDIVDDNGYNIELVEASTVAAQLTSGSLIVINGNYAIGAKLDITKALAKESSTGQSAQTYGNIIAVKSGNENSEKIKVLIETLKTDKVKAFIESKYKGAVQAIW